MNEVTTFQTSQLPDTLEDLTQFVLVGKAKLDAYMLKLRTVNRLSTAQEIRDQTLKEAQEVSTALIAAEQRIGELLLAIPKASGNQYTSAFSADGEKAKSKAETIKEMGYGKNEASDYQRMAQNPEIVQKIIDEALANGEIVTKSQVIKEIADAKRQAREENEKLRRALSESEAKRISEKSQTREVIKEVEVVPDDYAAIKKRIKSLESENRLLADDRQRALDRANESDERIKDLEHTLNSPEEAKRRNLEARCFDLTSAITAFLGKHGGEKFSQEELIGLSKYEKQSLERAIDRLRNWIDEFMSEVEVTYELRNQEI